MERADYPDLITLLKPSLGGDLSLQHVEFNRDITNGLASPTLEIVWFNAKPGLSQTELLYLVEQLGNALAEAKGCHAPIGWGESREIPGRIVCAIGWDTYDVSHFYLHRIDDLDMADNQSFSGTYGCIKGRRHGQSIAKLESRDGRSLYVPCPAQEVYLLSVGNYITAVRPFILNRFDSPENMITKPNQLV